MNICSKQNLKDVREYSSWSLWIGLLRPKTLFVGLSPILVAIIYTLRESEVDWYLASLLAVVALTAQIASNIANDLWDYRKGGDTPERKGPLRPLSKGLIRERDVWAVLALFLSILLFSGGLLIATTSWYLLIVGLTIILALFAYSAGPFPLSHYSLGEFAVLVFFGWIPVLVSYYVLTGAYPTGELFLLSTSLGLASANVLVVNNYRDYEEDRQSGKNTLIVCLGKDFASPLYRACGLLSMLLLFPLYTSKTLWILFFYGFSFFGAYKGLNKHVGEELNRSLALTSANVLLLSICISLMILIA